MKLSIFSILAVTAAVVSSVSAQEFPTCAKNCVTEIISQKLLTCATPNAACVCSGTEVAVRNVATCVQGTCNQADLQEFVKQVLDTCGPTTTTKSGPPATATGTGTGTTRVTAPTGGNTTTRRTTTTSAPTTTGVTTVTGNFTLTSTLTTTRTSNGTATTSATTTTSSAGAAVKAIGGSGAAGMGGVAIALLVAAFLG